MTLDKQFLLPSGGYHYLHVYIPRQSILKLHVNAAHGSLTSEPRLTVYPKDRPQEKLAEAYTDLFLGNKKLEGTIKRTITETAEHVSTEENNEEIQRKGVERQTCRRSERKQNRWERHKRRRKHKRENLCCCSLSLSVYFSV